MGLNDVTELHLCTIIAGLYVFIIYRLNSLKELYQATKTNIDAFLCHVSQQTELL